MRQTQKTIGFYIIYYIGLSIIGSIMELDVYRYDEGRLKRYVMLPEKLEYNHPDLVQSIKTKDIVMV